MIGPALIYDNGTKHWMKNGEQHREDGPAYESYKGGKAWWYKNKFIGSSSDGYTQQDFDNWLKFKVFE